jgi:protein-S-isoprenylcysteine O-methyltransferase Ste14
MRRGLFLLFGGLAYLLFFATFLYLVAFVGNFPLIPRSVDHGPPAASVAAAVACDIGLIAIFGLQHSVMARSGFKRGWTRLVPPPVERSVYVLFASLALILLFLFWRPLPQPLWVVDGAVGVALLWGLFATGWLIVLLSTFLISHFELFGLAQVYRHMRGRAAAALRFRQPFFYKLIRHPLYSGFVIAFWATPAMTMGHLLLALGMTVYMLIAIQYEERDLVRLFGQDYESYRRDVGMLTPRLRRRT